MNIYTGFMRKSFYTILNNALRIAVCDFFDTFGANRQLREGFQGGVGGQCKSHTSSPVERGVQKSSIIIFENLSII